MDGLIALSLAKRYAAETMEGAGAIKGDKGDKGDPGAQGEQGEQGEKGDAGYSPEITVYKNTETEYKLNIKTEDDEFQTPNLKGNGGSGDVEPLTEKQINSLMDILD